MKHTINFFITTYLLVSSHACYAMEKENKTIFREIPITNDERHAEFINKHQVIIQGNTSCRIFDLKTNTTIKQVENPPANAILDLHPNKKLFALTAKNRMTVYDTETMQPKYACPLLPRDPSHSIFSPTKNSIFVWHTWGANLTLQEQNYNADKITQTLLSSGSTQNPKVSINPITHQFCLQTNNSLSLYDDQKSNPKNTFTHINQPIQLISYSPKGDIIAYIHNHNNINVINLDNNNYSNLYSTNNKRDVINSAAFHPNSSVLAIVGVESADMSNLLISLRYIDIHSGTIIEKVPLPIFCAEIKQGGISFTPNGKKILIKSEGILLNAMAFIKGTHKLIVLDVSDKVIYEDNYKDKAIWSTWILTHIEPTFDIRKLIIKFLLKKLKR